MSLSRASRISSIRRLPLKRVLQNLSYGLGFGLLCWACQPDDNSSSQQNDLLVYCSEGSPDSFNPQLVTSGTSFDATARTVYSQLVTYASGSTTIEPALAESWIISDDGLSYRFKLRNHVEFHGNNHFTPTRSFNADDVLFSFNRQRLVQHPYHAVGGGRYPYFSSQSLDSLITDIRKISEYEVEFVLSRPESPFLSMLATPFASILSAEYASQLNRIKQPEWIDSQPIGTGPFRFKRYQADAFIRFERFDNYFGRKPRFKDLVYSITPDAAMRFARFSAGECDIMSYPLPVHLRIAAQNNFQVLQVPGLNVAYWAFNVEKPPFHDVKVRQALSMAINREAILKAVYDKQALLATNPIPPSSWAFNPNTPTTRYNPQIAKQLLSEAGYNNGFSIDIWAMPVQRAYNPNARKMAQMMQQDLKAIGVDARIISYEWGSFLSRVAQGQHHSVLLGWNADNGDPNNFFTPLLSCASADNGNNYANWCHPEFDQLILKARQISDNQQRTQHYHQAQLIAKQQAPWLTIAHANSSLLVQNRVKNLKISPVANINFDGVSLSKKITKPQTAHQTYSADNARTAH
ncbi:MAG: ABC transporter substrate-binding protein [Kangiellaceae bacterium]|nr:ABC transporter substrate-binding protein [Kangiellaceae bacterium]